MTVYYFSYGVNMSQKMIEERNLNFKLIGKGKLEDYAITFHRYSAEWNGLTATLERKDGHHTWGVIFETDEESMDRLDMFEGLEKEETERISLPVLTTKNETVICETYIRKHGTLPDVGNFSLNYLNLLLESYKEHHIPIEQFDLIESKLKRTFVVDRTKRRKRTFTRGKYLIQIDGESLNEIGFDDGEDVVVAYRTNYAPARIQKVDTGIVEPGICRLDKSIRNVLGLDEKTLQRATVTIYPIKSQYISDYTTGEKVLKWILALLSLIFFAWIPYLYIKKSIYPRTFLLKVQKLESDIIEKNIAIVPKQYLKLIGIEEGKFIDIIVPIYVDDSFLLKYLTIRAFSDENIEASPELKSQKIYLDETTRSLIGLPELLTNETFPFSQISPNLNSLLTERGIIYLATILFLVGRFQTLLLNFGSSNSILDFWIAVVFSIWFIGFVVYFELKNKIRY